MKRVPLLLALLLTLRPHGLAGQVDVTERVEEVLPPHVAQAVLERIEQARARDLPVQPVANVALEGVAKGRGADEVLAAVDLLVADMGNAREALANAGRVPLAGEVEAATAAMRMGVDGATVSALARSGPSGRTLAVPLLVVGSLQQRGLPSDEALGAVLARLQARADDMALVRDMPGMVPPQAGRPEWAGPPDFVPGPPGTPGAGRPPLPVGPPVEPGPRAGRGKGGPPGGS